MNLFFNPKIIDYICNQFKERYRHGEVIQMPDFGVITNGTLMNNRILDVLKKHISYITVSIDGPQYINDANRIFHDGKGSYEKVMSFINTIKQDTNISIRYEATYTDFCVKQNVMHTDIYNFFKSMGLDGVVTDDTNIKSTVIKKTEKPVTNFSDLELPEGFWSILSAIARREPKQTCQIVNEMFAVSAVGDIYACHMDNGIAEAKLGSIFGKNIFNSPKDYYDKHPLIPLLTDKEKLCGDCWAKNICAGCTRKWFFNSEDSRYYPTPNEDLCIRNQRHIDEIILLIAKIRKNPLLWNELLSIVYHRNNQDCNE